MSKIDDLITHLLDGVAMSIYDTREVVEDYQRVRVNIGLMHSPHAIYDECDCTDEQKEDSPDTHIEVPEVGNTCRIMYHICSECCMFDGNQTEDCAYYHKHDDSNAICATVAIFTGEPTP